MKPFLEMQPKIWKDIYSYYIQLAEPTRSSEELSHLLSEKIKTYGFTEEQAAQIVANLTSSFGAAGADQFINPQQDEARLSLYDIRLLKEKLLHESSPEVCRLLVTFLVYARLNPHPSFWIKYDRKVILFLSSLSKNTVSQQMLLTNLLHTRYNLDMQVVGSNQPTPCFKIAWQADQPPVDSPENPLVLIGPLTPATIKAFADQIPYQHQFFPEETTRTPILAKK